jgi:hypothetical protein
VADFEQAKSEYVLQRLSERRAARLALKADPSKAGTAEAPASKPR